MRLGIELLLVAAAAYALGFTFDVLLGGLLQAYPASGYLAVGSLSLVAAVLFIVAFKLSARNRWLALPLAALGALALLSVLAVVGGENG